MVSLGQNEHKYTKNKQKTPENNDWKKKKNPGVTWYIDSSNE